MATAKKVKKDLDYYLDLPWTFTIGQELDKNYGRLYIIRVNELPGVVTDGSTISEAVESMQEALALALSVSLKEGDEINEPLNAKLYRGNIAYRTTSERHYRIAKEARKRNLSLSQAIDTFIDDATRPD